MTDTTQDAPELLPCPFCGGDAEMWRANDNRPAWIACMGRCAVLISKEHKTDVEAISAWNTRADTAQAMVAAALTEAAEAVEDYCSDAPDLAGHGHSVGIRDYILALITPDAQAALDRVRADQREKDAKVAEGYLGCEAIAAAIREGGE